MQNPENVYNLVYCLPQELCRCTQTYATYSNICNLCKLLETSTILSTAFPKTYARVRRHMQLMQTYATYADICNLCKHMQLMQTYANLCKILKSYKIIFTAFPETYALVRRHMPPMQTYAKS